MWGVRRLSCVEIVEGLGTGNRMGVPFFGNPAIDVEVEFPAFQGGFSRLWTQPVDLDRGS
jgi:hypothetical protein